jgi:hypothetical protein
MEGQETKESTHLAWQLMGMSGLLHDFTTLPKERNPVSIHLLRWQLHKRIAFFK